MRKYQRMDIESQEADLEGISVRVATEDLKIQKERPALSICPHFHDNISPLFHYNHLMREMLHRLSVAEKNTVLEQLADAMARREEVLFAYVFGSFTDDTPFRDIDVGIFLADTDPTSAQRIAAGTAGLMEQVIHLPIDVCVLNFTPLPFLYHVIRGRLIFERDEDLRVEIVERTVRRYLDIKPVLLRSTREAFAA